MKRSVIAAFAIAASILVATAAPAAAADPGLEIGSQYTTDTDFGNAATLENTSVSGTGESADVLYDPDRVPDTNLDGFEDGDLTGWNVINPSVSASNSRAARGSWSMRLEETGVAPKVERGFTAGSYSSLSYWINVANEGAVDNQPEIRWYGTDNGGSEAIVTAISYSSSEIRVHNGTGWRTVATGLSLDTWYRVQVKPDYGTDTVDVEVYDSSGSQVSTLSGVDMRASADIVDVDKFWAIGFGSGTDFYVDEIRYGSVTDYQTSAQYISANHSVEEVEDAAVNLSITNADVDVAFEYWDGSSWQTANSSTYSSDGNKTLDISGHETATKWRTNITYTRTADDPLVELHDETYLFQADDPTVSLNSPTKNKKLNTDSVTLEAQVNDSDFATQQGDSVEVKFQTQDPDASTWTTQDTQTVTSNGTVSTTFTASLGGEWDWRVTVSDDYGESATSNTRKFTVPATLYIRNETNTSELVDSSIDVTVRFFGEDKIYSRTSSNGKVSMTGLPVNQPFIVEVEASSDYHGRTVYLKDIYQQDSVYLLNTSETSVESRFTLSDPTGEYDSSTVIYIQKPINQSGTVEYRTVHADKFGVEGVTADLEKGARYRVKIEAEDGTSQDIGPYRADIGETVTVTPGSPTIELGNYSDGWAANASLEKNTIEFAYDDPDDNTSNLKVYVHEKGNASNILGTNRTFTDLGTTSGTYSLTNSEANMTWVVNFEVTRGSETFTKQIEVGKNPDLVPDLSPEWRLIFGIGVLLISAGIFSVLNAGLGGVIVAIEGGVLWWTGWLQGATAGAAVVFALFIAVLAHIYTSSDY